VGGSKNGDNEETSQTMSSFLDKDLDAALDSFDNLFCRRCLVSDLSCIFSYLSVFYFILLLRMSLYYLCICRFLIADCMDVLRILCYP